MAKDLMEIAGHGKKRCSVYIDGFNMYYGVFKDRPNEKWFNIESYFDSIMQPEVVVSLKYFTAKIEGSDQSSLEKRTRQNSYLTVLRSLPKTEVVFGKFQNKTLKCGKCFQEYPFSAEKKTDVNIALHMTVDAAMHAYDSMVLVSGDSDLHPVCEWIFRNRPEITLRVLIPATVTTEMGRKADLLKRIGIICGFMPTENLRLHQFPDPVPVKFGTVPKPATWI